MTKVFIAEDSEIQAILLGKILVQEGYKVRIFNNGNDLIDGLEKEIPNLIISDLEMPELSGFELLESLKQTSYQDIPFFFVSSHFDDRTIEKALTMGADFFLKKPLDIDKLVSTTHRFLN